MSDRAAIIPGQIIESGAWAKLPPAAAKVLIVLSLHANASGECWPSLATIARLAGVHRGTAIRAAQVLESEGLVEREESAGGKSAGGKYHTTKYRLAVAPALPIEGVYQSRQRNLLPRAGYSEHHDLLLHGFFWDKAHRPVQNFLLPVVTVAPAQSNSSASATQKDKGKDKGTSTPRSAVSEALVFPVRGGETYSLTKAKASEYQTTYPALDVRGELRKARQWLLDNPGRRKTARGMTKFIGGWLSRASKDTQAAATAPVGVLDADPVEPPDEIFIDE